MRKNLSKSAKQRPRKSRKPLRRDLFLLEDANNILKLLAGLSSLAKAVVDILGYFS